MPTREPSASSLHELNPTSRFSDRADDYAKFRPSYPAAAIDAIASTVSDVNEPLCADVGAGTGISSRLLADRAINVIAIEPNEPMRSAAQAHPRVQWREGTAESTGLPSESVDLVLCAQAFHWFDADKALAEFHRILKPRATLCLMWNDRDDTDPLTAEYGRLILEASGQHPAALDRSACGEVIFHTPLFTSARLQRFPYEQPMTLEGLIGRALSASYVPKQGAKHDELIAGLQRTFDANKSPQALVRMRYTTRIYTATKASRV